ncbi:Oxidoreductase FAD/NAD(P)-binding domain protein [Candidatus Zixiibacteriota bacterium]|nr:Oxidoreductase FAD/NAD(P)-binding domain protein [candidate division Zixibacteria bacterium]
MAHDKLNPMEPKPFRVVRIRKDTYDTFTLELEPGNGGGEWMFQPGQFNMLYIFGTGEVPISISGDPGKPKTLVHTTRAVGTVTKAMRKLKSGDIIGVRGPYGAAWPVQEAEGKDVLVVAGGIGLAPLRPVIYHMLNNREKFGRLVLLYGARTPDDILYWQELESWRSRFDLEVHVTVDRAVGKWQGNVGVVTTLISKAPINPEKSLAMVCGPEIMMRYTVLELQKRGLSQESIYISAERNMKCGIGLCGHCQMGQTFVCKDGPVFRYDRVKDLFTKREI